MYNSKKGKYQQYIKCFENQFPHLLNLNLKRQLTHNKKLYKVDGACLMTFGTHANLINQIDQDIIDNMDKFADQFELEEKDIINPVLDNSQYDNPFDDLDIDGLDVEDLDVDSIMNNYTAHDTDILKNRREEKIYKAKILITRRSGFSDKKDFDEGNSRNSTIAYYSPFHSFHRYSGIYMKKKGLAYKARYIKNKCSGNHNCSMLSDIDYYIIAKTSTYFHEFYHHKIEAFATRIECVTQQSIYNDGFSKWYKATKNKSKCYEETLANYYAFNQTLDVLKYFYPLDTIRFSLINWFSCQPKPYKNAINYLFSPLGGHLERQFLELIVSRMCLKHKKKNSVIWEPFTMGLYPFINKRSDVVYIK